MLAKTSRCDRAFSTAHRHKDNEMFTTCYHCISSVNDKNPHTSQIIQPETWRHLQVLSFHMRSCDVPLSLFMWRSVSRSEAPWGCFCFIDIYRFFFLFRILASSCIRMQNFSFLAHVESIVMEHSLQLHQWTARWVGDEGSLRPPIICA